MIQKLIAFAIVAIAAGWLAYKLFSATLRPAIAKWLLKKGKVDLAMKLRGSPHHHIHPHPHEDCDPKKEG